MSDCKTIYDFDKFIIIYIDHVIFNSFVFFIENVSYRQHIL